MLEKWDIITGYADHFEWDSQSNAAGTGKGKGKKGKKEKKEKGGKNGKNGIKPKILPPSSFQLVAVCRDLM